MRACESSGKPLSYRLVNFLLSYRSTPHATTNRTPSSLFLKRELRTRMDLLRPDSTVRVGERQLSQKCDHDRLAKEREYSVGDNVMARNYGNGPKWMSSVVIEWKGPLSYTVQLESGLLWRRHIDQLQDGIDVSSESDVEALTGGLCSQASTEEPRTEDENASETPTTTTDPSSPETAHVGGPNRTDTSRYPRRVHRPPQRYSEQNYS